MRWFLLLILLSGCSNAKGCVQPDVSGNSEASSAQVVRIVDGDTIVVRTADAEENVRLKGIDCPEPSHNSKCRRDGDCAEDIPRGKVATRRLEELLHQGDDVHLVSATDGVERDRYGRILAYVELDGVDLGHQLVREGLCEDFGHEYPHPRGEAYRESVP